MSTSCDDFDDDFSPIPKDSSADSKLNEYIIRKVRELSIRKLAQDLPEVPTEQNGYLTVEKFSEI